MSILALPHTAGCLVCGRDNPHGLHLNLHVDSATGVVHADYVPQPTHIGFEGIVHGGMLATVLDEAMVWAATWTGRRFCVCGEMNIRYRQSARVGAILKIDASVVRGRSRLIEAISQISDAAGTIYCTATGKYVPVSVDRHEQLVRTFLPEPAVQSALTALSTAH